MQNGDHLQKLTWNYSACVEEAENFAKHADNAGPVNLAEPENPGNHAGRANNLYLYYKWD